MLPVFLLILWPFGLVQNEYNYFLLPLRRVAPEQFSAYSAVFDWSDARVIWEYVVGHLMVWFGYDLTHGVLRIVMAGVYAAAVGLLFNALRLSALDAYIVLGLFLVAGQDILGKEWLFVGVESKTFAYALIMAGLAFVIRERVFAAILLAAVATYLHFLVGGFWLLALLGYDLLQRRAPRETLRYLAVYLLMVSPLAAVIAYQHLGGLSVAPRDPSASYIYSILRAPHHVAPFASWKDFATWAPDIVLLLALTGTFLFLARIRSGGARALVWWVAGLLLYLVFALILSAFDYETGYLGKFYLFRPSSLTLFCACLALMALWRGYERGAPSLGTIRKATFLFIIPIAAFGVIAAKAKESSDFRRAVSADIERLNAYVVDRTGRDEIVLVEPGPGEYVFPKVALPMLLDRPTLVSFKFVPTNARDIYRWYDLLQFRDAVFQNGCRGIDRFPVRYLLMTRNADMTVPCGRIVWTSDYFVLVEP